ncbi:MAG: hypothetical protein ACOWWM_05310 [Desulfobacterales bacterium]
MQPFQADCRALLIGSLPLADHNEAFEWVMSATPMLPLWVQLPAFPEERMIPQFAPGMPGLVQDQDRLFVDVSGQDFEAQLLDFYEAFMAVSDDLRLLDASRFALNPSTAPGFHVFMERMSRSKTAPAGTKGQVTGPITFGIGLHDRSGRSILFDPHARDAAVKLLAMKARWQIRRLKSLGAPVILFLDEPALAGYGSSELISVSREEIIEALGEVIEAVHEEEALAGVHVCANTDWSMILDAGADIVNFDAYGYFDRFVLYPDSIKRFLEGGGIVAWGLVPTLDTEAVDRESFESLKTLWDDLFGRIMALGVDRGRLASQSLITPSCGTGSLSAARARKVLDLTRTLSEAIRVEHGFLP